MTKPKNKGLESLLYFFKLGLLGFGGPLAILSQIQKDLIEKRKWMSQKEFNEVLPLIKTMPGPIAFQTVIYVSRQYSNLVYAFLSGLLFILPSFLMMILLVQFESLFKESASVQYLFQGFQIGAMVLIVLAFKSLTQSYWKFNQFWFFLILGIILLGYLKWNEALVILSLGGMSIFAFKKSKLISLFLDFFLVCLQAGAFSFGTGLTIVPLLENQVVNKLQLLSQGEFLNALALGQLTPGPVIISVVYIGFKSFGWAGAFASAAGVFGPGLINMVTWFPRAKSWLAHQTWYSDFLVGALAGLSAGILLAVMSLLKNFTYQEIFYGLILGLITVRFNLAGWLMIMVSGVLYAGYFFMYSL